jgi:virulence-associated protein VapD
MKQTRQIRHDIYDYLEQQGFNLTPEQISYLSTKIQEHSDNKAYNLKEISSKHGFANDKIAAYLKKAATLPQSPKLQAQVETLHLVSGWLNEDIDGQSPSLS